MTQNKKLDKDDFVDAFNKQGYQDIDLLDLLAQYAYWDYHHNGEDPQDAMIFAERCVGVQSGKDNTWCPHCKEGRGEDLECYVCGAYTTGV